MSDEQLRLVARRLEQLTAAIASDAYAISFQTMGQYRSALLKIASGMVERCAETAFPDGGGRCTLAAGHGGRHTYDAAESSR